MGASNIARSGLAAVLLAAASACGGGSVSSVEEPTPVRFQIDTQGDHFDGPSPAELNAYLFSTPMYQLVFEGYNGQTMWDAILHLSRDEALAGHASVPISTGVLLEGQGSVQLVGGALDDWKTAMSGSVDFSLSGGRVSGSADVVPTALSGSFDGELGVSCWVLPSHLPSAAPAGGTAPRNGTEVLVADPEFTTPECQPFRALVPGT